MDSNHVTRTQIVDTVLAVSLELSAAQWKVALHDWLWEKPAVHTVNAARADARLQAVLDLIELHKQKWSPSSREFDCYVVDAASIPVQRHKRRAKTDRLDAIKLVINLHAWLCGERDRMRVVRKSFANQWE